MKTAQEPQTLTSLVSALGITIETSAPSAGVDKAESKDSKAWPHIAYDVTLIRNGRKFWSGPYKLGTGYAKTPSKFEQNPPGLTQDEVYALNTLRARPHATLADSALAASVAAKLAKAQGFKPALDSVMHSLLMDGSPYFQGASFEEWADDCGYDTDSRTAEKMYSECMDTGRQLSRAFTAEELAQLQEAASEF